jgi:hypothetical protein
MLESCNHNMENKSYEYEEHRTCEEGKECQRYDEVMVGWDEGCDFLLGGWLQTVPNCSSYLGLLTAYMYYEVDEVCCVHVRACMRSSDTLVYLVFTQVCVCFVVLV